MIKSVIIFLALVKWSPSKGQGSPPTSFETYTPQVVVSEIDSDVRFDCVPATGTPPLTYSYLKNGNLKANGSQSIWRFLLDKSSQGNYRCIAANQYGALLGRVSAFHAGYFEASWASLPLRNIIKPTGSVAELELPPYSSYPDAIVQWKVDGNLVNEERYLLRHFESTHSKKLIILDLRTAENSNIYIASAKVIFTTTPVTTPAYNLMVTGPDKTTPLAPVAVIEPKSAKFPFNKYSKNVHFECVFNARPLENLRIVWYHRPTSLSGRAGRTLITNTLHYSLSSRNRTLKIVNVQANDAGTYECEALLDPHPVVVKSATLTYQFRAKIIVKGETDITVKYGDRKELPCQPDGIPTPTVRWYRNAVLLGSLTGMELGVTRYQILSSGTLVMKSALPSDAGVFQCFVANEIGEEMHTIWVKVKSSAPVITKSPQNTSSIEGEVTTLSCTASGAPTPAIRWRRGESGPDVISSSVIRVVDGSLVMIAPRPSDSGPYTCEATNVIGVVRATAYLRIKIRTRITKRPPPTLSVVKHDTLYISCGFEHDPDVPVRVEWMLTRSPGSVTENITAGAGMRTRTDGTLIVEHVRYAGTYKCSIYSVAGNDSAQTVVTVKSLPEKPTMTSADLNSEDKQAVDLKWIPGFDGYTPILEFIISKTEMNLGTAAGSPTVVTSVGPTVREYTVRNLLSSRTYVFCVTAKNEVGQSARCGQSRPITMPQLPPSGPPRSVYATAPSQTTIVVSWSPPQEQHHNGPLLGYILRYRPSKYHRIHIRNITTPTTRRYTLDNLVPFTEYEIYMAAYNAKGQGVFSSAFPVMTQEGIPGSPPTNVSLVAISSTEIRAYWRTLLPTDVNGINLGYKIRCQCLSPTSGCMEKTVTVPHKEGEEASMVNFLVTGLHKYGLYRVTIWCFTSRGPGVSSPPFEIRTKQDVPGPVSNLRFDNVVDTSIDVIWDPPAQPNGIVINYTLSYRMRDTTDPKTDSFTLGPEIRSKRIKELRHRTWYIVSLVAHTKIGAGTASSFSVRSGVPPKIPEAPSSLIWSNAQARSVILQFTPGFDGNSSISKWIVEGQVSSSEESSWSEIFIKSDPTADRLEVTGLIPYTKYRLRIIAENIKGRSSPSPPTDWFQTQEAPPSSAPQGLITRVTSATSISVRWRPLQSDTWNGVPQGYRVFYRPSWTALFGTRDVADSNANSLLLDDLRPFSEYQIKISAYNNRGLGPTSPVVRDRTWEGIPDAGPTDVAVGSVTSTSAVISWTVIANESMNSPLFGYHVIYRMSSTGTIQKTTINGLESSSVALSPLKPFSVYDVQVAPYNRIGDGPKEPQPAVIFRTSGSRPAMPDNLYFPRVTITGVTVAWLPPSSPNGILTGYSLSYHRTDLGLTSSAINRTLPVTQLSFVAESLQKDAQYEFQVAAVNDHGIGASKKATVMTTSTQQDPLPPGNPSVLNSKSGPNYVTVTWMPRDQISSPTRNYTLEYRRFSAPIGPWTPVHSTISGNQFTIRKLTPYTIYQFRVAANNDVGRSPFSNVPEDHRTAGTTPAVAPQIDRIEPLDRTTIEIRWQRIPAIAWNDVPVGYRVVYRHWTPDSRNLSTDVGHSLASTSLRLLTAGWYYEIRLAAFNAKGQGPLSPPKMIYVGEAKPTAAPSEFTCQNKTASEIECSWKSPSKDKSNGDLLGFKIFITSLGIIQSSRRKRSLPEERMIAVTSATTSASISDLKPFHRYSVQILAFNPAGDGPNGTMIMVKTKESQPGPPGKISLLMVTLQSATLTWDKPADPNGVVTYYRVEYRELSGVNDITRRVQDFVTARSYEKPKFMAQKLAEDTEYIFLVSARTSVGWGPSRNTTVKTGPIDGSPSPPTQLTVVQDSNSAELHWRIENAGSGKLEGAIIEAQRQGTDDWELLQYVRTGQAINFYRANFENLQPNSYYRFRVTAINAIGISSASKPSTWVKTPDYDQGPFYKQWWFLVIVALSGLIVIMITGSILCLTGRNRRARARARARTHLKYGYALTGIGENKRTSQIPIIYATYNNGASLDIPPTNLDGNNPDFGEIAMQTRPSFGSSSLYGTTRRTSGIRTPNSTLPRHAASTSAISPPLGAEIHSTLSRKHLKSPPRPSPASVTTSMPEDSSDDDSKNPMPSSKGSDSSETTTRKHHPDSDSDYTDEFDDEEFDKFGPAPPPLSFVGVHKPLPEPNLHSPPRWSGHGPVSSNNPYSFSDSDTSTLPYQTPNRMSLQQAGSRAPIPSYSSFV